MKYILANLVTGEAECFQQKMVRELSEKFDTHWLNDYWTPAHFTLKHLFEKKHISKIETILEKFSGEKRAYPVTISGFTNYHDAIVMNVKLSDDAFQTYMALINELKKIDGLEWGNFEAEERHFHMSVALFDVEKNYKDMCNYVHSVNYQYETQFNNIAILEQNDKGWIIRRLFTLRD